MTLESPSRRAFFGGDAALGAMATAATLAAVAVPASAQTPVAPPQPHDGLTDTDVLTFAYNLEYLEAAYYLAAVSGQGMGGGQTTGRQVAFANPIVAMYARNAEDSTYKHVGYLRSILGPRAAPDPQVDLRAGFAAVGQGAGLGAAFDPFADDQSFLLGSFLFQDVAVTAYKGAVPLIASRQVLKAAAGIHAVQAYYAGAVRAMLYRMGPGARAAADRISAFRDQLDGPTQLDQGIDVGGRANIIPCDSGGVTFSRTPQQVLNIVYGAPGPGVTRGGFFPNGVSGKVAST